MVSGCALTVVPELLAEFHELHPGVDIALTEADSDRLVERLRNGRLDLALIGSAGDAVPGLETALVADDALVAAVRTGHPLVARKTITVNALRDQALISLPHGTGLRAALDTGCANAGFEPRIAFEASALPMVAQLAGMGLGVAILPASMAQAYQPALQVLQICRPQLRSRLEIIWDPTASNPAARVLIGHTRTFMHRLAANRAPAA